MKTKYDPINHFDEIVIKTLKKYRLSSTVKKKNHKK